MYGVAGYGCDRANHSILVGEGTINSFKVGSRSAPPSDKYHPASGWPNHIIAHQLSSYPIEVKKIPLKTFRGINPKLNCIVNCYLILFDSLSSPVCLCLDAFTWLLPKR